MKRLPASAIGPKAGMLYRLSERFMAESAVRSRIPRVALAAELKSNSKAAKDRLDEGLDC